MNQQYELRTASGRPVMVFDNEDRARAKCHAQSQRIGAKLSVWRVTRHEERIS